MPNRIKITFLLILAILYLNPVSGQGDSKERVLQMVGAIDSLYSTTLDEYREFYVQYPLGYNPESDEKYPVVYVLDGDVFLPTVHNVQQFYSGGFTPEMILIGISNANNRTRDLTTSEIKMKWGRPFNVESGGADDFIQFIESELIPFIENKYPVTEFRTLIGHSYGGLFTINALINHPHLFSNYIAIDPSLDWDDQKLMLNAEEKLITNDYHGKSLFMSLGGQLHRADPSVTIDNVMEDQSDFTVFARSNIMFSDMLKQHSKNGLAFEWKFYPRDLHGTIPFPSIMDGLISTFQWFQMEHTDKFNSPDTPREELEEIIHYRSDKLERYFNYPVPPYPEDLLNALGYMSLDMGQNEKSKMFFEFAIRFYSQSPNAYDSMADYYERNNDYEKALKYVRKAFELSGADYHKERILLLEEKK